MTVATSQPAAATSRHSVTDSWRVYAIDGMLLGLFMVSACTLGVVIEHPASPLRRLLQSDALRRGLFGLCMALTAVCLIYSRWGRRSGALMNPAMVVGFLRLGRLRPADAIGFTVAQLIGSSLGVLIVALLLGRLVSDPSVNYVATVPGTFGLLIAWLAEFLIALVMMSVVMAVNKQPRLAPFTGWFAAALVFLYITFEAPISGMSLNPARTFGSAVVGNVWIGWWIYLTAPVLGMLGGIELHRLVDRGHQRLCGKLNHSGGSGCFIRCNCVREQ
jgi:aquaporin Z